ncbi:hypothetical protein OU798_07415 [Prolixibacteraceae bacterium Z1-6]|uniref:Uncharacterized protein n=1 Tax=Draconibacterium aestuarii TaxID=2998507 RepID=A0A9X3J6Z8_9BACT|nr:hypothetical protein [Prolixibacteraceae bacterium Z1-6]
MKSYLQNNSNKQNEKANLWDAFVTYLETTYFPGASETLETKLIAFEYEQFKSCYS